jgi:hypothetical protein
MATRSGFFKPLLSGIALSMLTAAAAAVAPSLADAATLNGDSIQIYYLYPDKTTVYDTLGPVTDPASGPGDALHWAISGNQITLTAPVFGTSFGAATFNGYEFLDLTRDPGIVGVSLDPSTTANLASVSDISFTSDSVFFNFQGKSWYGSAVYNLTLAATPLPATLPLFASGLGLLGLVTWRGKRNAAAQGLLA